MGSEITCRLAFRQKFSDFRSLGLIAVRGWTSGDYQSDTLFKIHYLSHRLQMAVIIQDSLEVHSISSARTTCVTKVLCIRAVSKFNNVLGQ